MKIALLEAAAFLLLGAALKLLGPWAGKGHVVAFHFLSACFLAGGLLISMTMMFRVSWSGAFKKLVPLWKLLSLKWPLLFIPLLFVAGDLYDWRRFSGHKALYYSMPFLVLRNLLYMVLAWLAARKMAQRPALSMILFFFVGTFVSFDWGMSLEGPWSSNIYGLLWLANGSMIAAAAAFFPVWSALDKGDRKDVIAIMFTLSALSAYLHYSQFIIMWMANRPNEVVWYLERSYLKVPGLTAIIFTIKLLPITLAALFRGRPLSELSIRLLMGSFLLGPFLEILWLISPSLELPLLYGALISGLLLSLLYPTLAHWKRSAS